MIIVDPPSGWRFGFPKPIPKDRLQDVNTWLVEQGYPQEIIDDFEGSLPCRFWDKPDEESSETLPQS